MRVIFMGTPDFATGTLEEIVLAGHEVVGVVTQPDKPKGRGKTPVSYTHLMGMGNNVNALNMARQAQSMDPGNPEYANLVNRIQWNSNRYQQGGGYPYANNGGCLLYTSRCV